MSHGLSFSVAKLLGTWFGVGLSPFAPGTAGSAAALPFAWLILHFSGAMGLLVASIAVSLIGWWACAVYVRETGKEDPSEMVIDEVAGMWLTLLPYAYVVLPEQQMIAEKPWMHAIPFIVAFFSFRLFDIWKPWPVRWADRKVPGGLGVMLDDILAAWYAALVTVLVLVMLAVVLANSGVSA